MFFSPLTQAEHAAVFSVVGARIGGMDAAQKAESGHRRG
jgi:hypothetical protein